LPEAPRNRLVPWTLTLISALYRATPEAILNLESLGPPAEKRHPNGSESKKILLDGQDILASETREKVNPKLRLEEGIVEN
jgi:hypothetical protein